MSLNSTLGRVRVLGSLVVCGLAIAVAVPAWSAADEISATPETLADAFAKGTPGDVIRLAAGDSGSFLGGVKPGMVTIKPAPGAIASISVDLDKSQNIRFEGLVMKQAYVGDSRKIEFADNKFTGQAVVDLAPELTYAGIVFEDNT